MNTDRNTDTNTDTNTVTNRYTNTGLLLTPPQGPAVSDSIQYEFLLFVWMEGFSKSNKAHI